MDAVSIRDLRALASDDTQMCVSLYATTHPAGAEGEQDALRWKQLLQDAEHGLMDRGLSSPRAKQFLLPAFKLSQDPVFWQNRSHGLAVFISRETFSYFRVPTPFHEAAIVTRRFHIKRLLPLVIDSSPFYILTLSQNMARLYKASHFRIKQLNVALMPANMDDSLNYTAVDRGSQLHSAMKGQPGKQAVVFHGQGGERDTHKNDLAEYFRLVDAAIRPVLKAAPAPLLLAGVEYLIPIYRAVSSLPDLLTTYVKGNCDYSTPNQLLVHAWPVVESALRADEAIAVRRFTDQLGTARTTVRTERVVQAAREGKIDVLFVNPTAVQWGVSHAEDGAAIFHEQRQPGDEDLLEVAVSETLMTKGAVYSLHPEQLPDDPDVAAVLRY